MRMSDWSSDVCSSDLKQIIPAKVKLLWGVRPRPRTAEQLELYAIRPSGVDAGPVLAGNVITDAKDDFDPQSNSPMVTMYMNSEGAREWRRISAAAVADPNNKQAIAIVLHGGVYSAPTIQRRSEERRVGKRMSVSVDLGGSRI